MIAIDTNVVVRFVVADDVEQASRARSLVEAQDVYLAKTVLLEAEWVLKSLYGYTREQILQALKGFLLLPRVVAEDLPGSLRAIAWAADGMDFADALHIVSGENCESFASFDRKLACVAARSAAVSVREP